MNSYLTLYRSKISKEVSRSMIAFFITSATSLLVYLFITIPTEQDEFWDKAHKLIIANNSYIESLNENINHGDNAMRLMQNMKMRMKNITPVIGVYSHTILPKDSIPFYRNILQRSLKQNSSDYSLTKALILDKNKKEDIEFLKVLNSEKVLLNNILNIITTNRRANSEDNEIYTNFGENLLTWGNYLSIIHAKGKQEFSKDSNAEEVENLVAINKRLKTKLTIVISSIFLCALLAFIIGLTAFKVGHL